MRRGQLKTYAFKKKYALPQGARQIKLNLAHMIWRRGRTGRLYGARGIGTGGRDGPLRIFSRIPFALPLLKTPSQLCIRKVANSESECNCILYGFRQDLVSRSASLRRRAIEYLRKFSQPVLLSRAIVDCSSWPSLVIFHTKGSRYGRVSLSVPPR